MKLNTLHKRLRHREKGATFLCLLSVALMMILGPSASGVMAQTQPPEVAPAIVENNLIQSNTAASAGAVGVYNSSPIIRNNMIIGNSASSQDEGGGGIHISAQSSKPTITGNTISKNNAASGRGGGIYAVEGQPVIANCIVWQNQGDLWNCTATYSDLTAPSPGTGNISAEPAFVQTTDLGAAGYYLLSDASPCIDAGDPSYQPDADEADIAGKARLAGAALDIGAYELPDTGGPSISNATFAGAALQNNLVLRESGTFAAMASDRSSVSRVEFFMDGARICTDTDGSDNYSCAWDIYSTPDGSHTLTITAYDTLGNSRSVNYTLTVTLSAPPAPVITNPQNGVVSSTANVTVSGKAESGATVLLYDNNLQTGAQATADSRGNFSIPVTLVDGANRLQATAANRTGTSPRSLEVLVTLDTSVPKAPVNMTAQAKAGGVIGLSWSAPIGTAVKGYNVYRASALFSSTAEAVRANSNPVTGSTFDDLPSADGIYYYAVCTLDQTNQESPLSNIASATADRTPPRAVSIEYLPAGHYNPSPLSIAQGRVNIRLHVNEPLQSIPFLSITPEGGAPIPVDLIKTSDLEYAGSFLISDTTPNGKANALFSARDLVGNRGTGIDSGASFIIDAQGPAVTSIETQPRQPIKNSQTNPVSVIVTIGLNEPVKAGSTPALSYLLSAAGRTPVSTGELAPVATQPNHAQTWQGAFVLPPDAGLAQVETLQFIYQGVDDLDTVGTRILCGNSFQVYQGNLPPLSPPQTLTAKSLPGGKIKLSWTRVDGAAGYQLYRKSPTETDLTIYQTFGTILESTDSPQADGLYRYAVASIRRENGQESASGTSNVVEVLSDSIPPGAPQNLVLALTGSGIKATWMAPPDTEPVTYSLYRSSLPEITSVQGLTPIVTGITGITAVDAHPSHTDHSYVVTAVDGAGNESAPSNSFYLNFDLLPVATLSVVQTDNDPPVLSWTHASGDIAGYNVYLGSGASQKLNATLLTDSSYVDTGYMSDERRYTVKAVDRYGKEMGRSITLPSVDAALNAGERVRRGIINGLAYTVNNYSSSKLEHAKLKLNIGTHQSESAEFVVDPRSFQGVTVPVGGFADMADVVACTTTMEITPEEGERVQIVRSKQIDVMDDRLILQARNEAFTRGGLGKVWFTLENTGEEAIEIVTATGSGGSASNEVALSLLDADGNVLSTQAYKQALGQSVLTLPNGATVARIQTGSIFNSEPIELTIPLGAPNQVGVRIDVAKVRFHYGQPDEIVIDGVSFTGLVSLKDTPYYGQITNVAPASSTGNVDITITGRAIDRTTASPLPSAPLNVVISVGGFDRTYNVTTGGDGAFAFLFKPLAGESGVYTVRAVHPDILDKPVQGQFVISKLAISPATINLSIPKNYEQIVNIQVTPSEGMTAHNLSLVYLPEDQLSGVLPQGIHVTPGAPIPALGSKQTGTLIVKIWADNTAATAGRIVLRVASDEDNAWGSVLINTDFSEARPALSYTPDHVETGTALNQAVTETITLTSSGLADLNDVALSLVTDSGGPAPGWVRLNSAASLGVMAIGEKREVSLTFNPASGSVPEGVYSFNLRVSASNYQTTTIRVYASVSQSGIGSALIKVSDIYTGTVDQNGQLVQGLSGAKITIQNEEVLTIEQTASTDSAGEALFTGLAAGRYKYRVSASNHQEQIGRLWIKPGLTTSEQVFLEYNLVTVEWQVVPTTIQDKYEIVLKATYETDVPAPVVVAEPASVNLPTMKAGEVYYGEYTLTNYGLVRADNLQFVLPQDDGNFRYELLKGLPTSLGAKERITVAYRVTALRSFGQEEEGAGSGGGCESYQAAIRMPYTYPCPNGQRHSGSAMHVVTYNSGGCVTPGTGPFVLGGSYGAGQIGGWGPSATQMQGFDCSPAAPRKEVDGKKNKDCKDDKRNNTWFYVGCSVNTVLREYEDDATDLSVKVPGGEISVKRLFYDDAWRWEDIRNNLQFTYDSLGRSIQAIDKGGVIYQASGTAFTNETYTIIPTGSSYLWQDKAGNWKQFEATGKMTSYGTRNGVVGKLLYDQNGRLVGVSDRNDQQVIWYEYKAGNEISVVRDLDNRRVEYAYASGKLSSVKDTMGYQASYDYSNGKLVKSTDYAGRQTFISYDGSGSVSQVLDQQGNGHFFQYSYDGSRNEYYAQIKRSSGMVKEVWYDGSGDTKLVMVNGRTIQSISKDGRNLIVTDEKGNVTRKDLDEWESLTRIVFADGTYASFEYEHRFNQVTRATDPRGNVTTYEYDQSGNLAKKIEAFGTSSQRTTTYTYDGSGQLVTATTQGDATTQAATLALTYDAAGNIASLTDPEGNKTEFLQYDNMGNLLSLKDPRGNVSTFTYDRRGRFVSATDPLGYTASFEYDGANNRTAITNAYLKRFEFEYNEYNKAVKATDPYGKYITTGYNTDNLPVRIVDQEGKESRFEYDNEERLVRSIDGAGSQVQYQYDATQATPVSSDLPVQVGYPTYTKSLYYDVRQRLIRETEVLSEDVSYATSYTYDAAGNILSVTDKENRTTLFEYDALNRLVGTTDPLRGVTERTYDSRNNLILLKDANGNATRYAYDRNNRLVSETRPMGQQTRYEYDASGNRIAQYDAKGQKIAYEYDESNRLRWTRQYVAGDYANPIKTTEFRYDKLGNLTSYNDGTTSGTYTYDDLSRKIGKSVDYGAFTLSDACTYYGNGLKQSYTGPDQITYTYTYDANNRLILVDIPGKGPVTYNAYQWHSPIKTTLPGGTSADLTYDPLMRLKSMNVKDPRQAALLTHNYEYSPIGNLTSKKTDQGGYVYGYDQLYRLTQATNPSSYEAYTYDAVGNRLTSLDVPGLWGYNENNELLSSGGAAYEYDANGNMTRRTIGGQLSDYVYDVANRLIQVKNGNGSIIASYYYDAFGKRLWKEVNGIRSYYFYSDEGLVGEYSAAGTEIKTYGYVPDSVWTTDPLFQKTGSTYYWYQNDRQGTPQKIADSSGRVVWAATYDAFGHAQITIAQIQNNLRFAGQYFDAETGLHYNLHRYYDPGTGRYLQVDPLRDGINPYVYTHNDPVNLIDPEGTHAIQAAGGLLTATAGVLSCFTLIGCVWGAPAAVYGIDVLQANIQSLIQGADVDTLVRSDFLPWLLPKLGVSKDWSSLVDLGLDVGLNWATGSAFYKLPKSVSTWMSGGETFYQFRSGYLKVGTVVKGWYRTSVRTVGELTEIRTSLSVLSGGRFMPYYQTIERIIRPMSERLIHSLEPWIEVSEKVFRAVESYGQGGIRDCH